MDTPKKGTLIEIKNTGCLFYGPAYSLGARTCFDNRLSCAKSISVNLDGVFSSRFYADEWRYPGETDWRK